MNETLTGIAREAQTSPASQPSQTLVPVRKPPKVYRKPAIPPQAVKHALAGIDPVRHLPVELHEQTRAFLKWLDAISDSEPDGCPYCGSTKRKVRHRKGPKNPRILYGCLNCLNDYNVLTCTPLAGMRNPHLWCAHLTLRLAGWSIWPISRHLQTSTQGASGWDRQFLILMEKQAPKLHRWWKTHQDRIDIGMPESQQQQADQFVAWVEGMSRLPGRLEGTPFRYMAFRSYWTCYARLLLQGVSDADIARELGMNYTTAGNWRRRFEQALEERHPELLGWVRWQLARRYNEVSEQTRRELQERACIMAATGSTICPASHKV
jgi:transposase-like protein